MKVLLNSFHLNGHKLGSNHLVQHNKLYQMKVL